MVLVSCQGLRTSLLSLVCLIVKGNVLQPCVRSSSRFRMFATLSILWLSKQPLEYCRQIFQIRQNLQYILQQILIYPSQNTPSSFLNYINKKSLQDDPSKIKVVRVRIFDTLHQFHQPESHQRQMCDHNDILWTLITDVFAQKFATKSTIAIVAGHKENKCSCTIPNIKNTLTISKTNTQ